MNINAMLARVLFVSAALMIAQVARATPYASSITNNGSSISFRLNESADGVKIISLGGAVTNDLGAKPAGLHTTNLIIVGAFQIEVSKNPGFGYLQGIATQVSFDTNRNLRFNAPRGVAVNRNPASPYFGRIYVANSDTGSVAASGLFPARNMVNGDGIFMLNADFTDAVGQADVARTAGLNFRNPVVTDQANKPHRIEVGEDDNLYIGDYSNVTNPVPTANLYVTDPDVGTNGNATNVFTFDPAIGGRIPSSAIAKGSLGGGNLTVYAIYPDNTYTYDEFGSFSFSVMQRWNVGAGPLPSAATPVRVTDLPILIADVPSVLSDIDIAPDGKYFIAQNRSQGLEAGLWVVDPALDANGSTYPDIVFNSYASSIAFFGATNDLLLQTRAVKVSPDNSVVCLIRDDNRVWIIPLVNGLPDLSRRLLMTTGSATSLGRDIGFDAAGNLYIASSGQGAVKVFTPGFGSRAVTDTAGAFTVTRFTNNPPQITISSGDTNLYERMSADTASFTLTRLGDISSALTVNLSYSGTAASGVHYGPAPASVTIPANAISVTTTTAPIDNATRDGNLTITVSIATGPDYTNGSQTAIDLLLRDDETTPNTPVLFSDDFDADTSANYGLHFGADNAIIDYTVAFNFDYSTRSIPSAPHSTGGTTLGLFASVNKTNATASGAAGVNLYPLNVAFSNEYVVRFDMYQTFDSLAAGTTEHAIFGVNHSGTRTNRALSANGLVGGDGVWAAIESDGSASSTARSYALFGSTNAAVAPPFSSASARTFDPFFTTPPFKGIPGGTPSGQWVDVELSQTNQSGLLVVTLKINGVTILSRTNNTASTNGTIMLGYMDSFASVGSTNNFVIYDNVRVVNLTVDRPNITAVRENGPNIEVDFTAGAADLPGAFTLESTTMVPGGFTTDPGSSIIALGPGSFRATSTNSTDGQRFYRVKR